MKIELKLIGNYLAYLPQELRDHISNLEIPDNSRVSDILALLTLHRGAQQVVLINGIGATLDQIIHDGDLVTIFDAIAGGNH